MTDHTAFDRIVGALEHHGCRTMGRGNRVRSQCPGHDSAGLSLIVSRRTDAAGVHCFAGCDTVDVLAVLGLTLRDLFDGELPPGYVPPPRRPSGPWDIVLNGPGVDHLLHRMVIEQQLEADPTLRTLARARHESQVIL